MIDKVKIGNIIYAVNEADILKDSDATGTIKYQSCKILIDRSLEKQMKEQVLLHEIIHGMFYYLGMEEEKNNECLVDAIAKGVICLFKDNPKLLELLKGEEHANKR